MRVADGGWSPTIITDTVHDDAVRFRLTTFSTRETMELMPMDLQMRTPS
jgi:hypothetical protein